MLGVNKEELDAATRCLLAEYIWLDSTPLGFVQSEHNYQVPALDCYLQLDPLGLHSDLIFLRSLMD